MSMKSWMEEFYPVEADEVSEADALEHSHRKWTGLLPENLKKHDVAPEEFYRSLALSDGEHTFLIDSSTCALCRVHKLKCLRCPLINCRTEFVAWAETYDPVPMIDLIEQAYKECKANKANKERSK